MNEVKNTKKPWRISCFVRSWLFKRIMLNIGWLIINVILLIAGAVLMSKYLPDFIMLWFFVVLIYGMAYRVIAMVIFDALIGDGWD
jgi:hypothetical protein